MIQIDMDMPKNCAHCPCGNAQDGWCYVHDEVLERTEKGYPDTTKRPDWCPLKEVKQGHWEELRPYDVRCSICGNSMMDKYPFCPECGAKMRNDYE